MSDLNKINEKVVIAKSFNPLTIHHHYSSLYKSNWSEIQLKSFSSLKSFRRELSKFHWKLLRTYFFPSISFSSPTENKNHLKVQLVEKEKRAIFTQELNNHTKSENGFVHTLANPRKNKLENSRVLKKEQKEFLFNPFFAWKFNYVLYSMQWWIFLVNCV